MMQQGPNSNYPPPSSYYPNQIPNPNPNFNTAEFPSSAFATASAPPYSHQYPTPSSSDYSHQQPYPSFSDPSQNLPPTAPSYAQPPQSLPNYHQSYAAPPPPQQFMPEHSQSAPASASYSQPPQYYPTYDSPQPSTFAPTPLQSSAYNPPPQSSAYNPPPQSSAYNPPPQSSAYNPPPQSSAYAPPPPRSSSYDLPPQSIQYQNSYPSYDAPYDTSANSRFDLGGGGGAAGAGGGGGGGGGGGYGYSRIGIGAQDDVFGDGIYKYDGGRSEPYGARGTKSASSWSGIDDYGRTTSFSSRKDNYGGSGKIVKAVPKVETHQDAKSGVQKFRVKLLAESSGQDTTDVLCQIGLDGIRMLDPNTNRTLRIYPLENVTRWEATDSTYSFWSKSSVDIEPRRIRLQSNNYTTSTILDTVAAATVQLKEMGGTENGIDRESGISDSSRQFDQSTEKKKGLFDFVNLIKPVNEEKDHWVPDDVVSKCMSCGTDFSAFVRKHHCRSCGDIFCDKCTSGRIALTADTDAPQVRVCDKCMNDVTRRLGIAKESAGKAFVPRSHEDLARQLQEEMDKKLRVSSGSSKKSSSSKRRMREVVCPTCTVHLQVELPSSGSETVECGVCQHPFLVNAR